MWTRPGWPRPRCPSRCAPGAGSNDKNRETLGRSRGGLTSKIHLLADSGCRPLARITSAGQRGDSLAFVPLMGQLGIARPGGGRPRTRPGRVLGDKAYSSAAIRAHLRRRGIKATIPEPSDQVRHRLRRGTSGGRPPAFDPAAYRDRNTVERAFSQLRQHRSVATRYDKRDFVWRGTIDVATIRIWLRHPTPHDLKDRPVLTTVIVAVGPVHQAGGHPVANLTAYRVAFLAAAAICLCGVAFSLRIHDADAASTLPRRRQSGPGPAAEARAA
jgi:transposase